MQVSLVRQAVWASMVDVVEDLVIIASMDSLDAIVLAELPADGCAHLQGAQWLTTALGRLRPFVVESAWPPRPVPLPASGGDLVEAARAAGLLLDAPELLLEQVCGCLRIWTGQDQLRKRAAKVLLEEVSKIQSGPSLLVDAANA
mmetsp:Transcript_122665/g.381874  ORF Transcript_122665/g.381874 Transcript_122665/m.381874 type:complete len:145 (+) Transcript_122665:938-1372(+)